MNKNKAAYYPNVDVLVFAGIFGMGLALVTTILFIMSLIGQIVFPFAPVVFFAGMVLGSLTVRTAYRMA